MYACGNLQLVAAQHNCSLAIEGRRIKAVMCCRTAVLGQQFTLQLLCGILLSPLWQQHGRHATYKRKGMCAVGMALYVNLRQPFRLRASYELC